MNHVPLAVVARMASPICLRDVLHLDGLLLHARELRDGAENRDAAFDALAVRHGVYAASCGFLVAEGVGGVAERPATRTRRLDLKGADGLGIRFPADATVAQRTVGSMSPMRGTLVVERVMANVREIAWQAMGDPDEIRDLVDYLPWIGKMHGTGYGEVSDWDVFPVGVDESTCGLVSGGRALRNLPVAVAEALGVEDPLTFLGRISPPYGRSEDVVPVAGPSLGDVAGTRAHAAAVLGLDVPPAAGRSAA